jgi:nitrite reductase/ring-hydroxylating ferredoxin subunit
MAEGQPKPQGPDLAKGIPLASLPDGALLTGHVGDEPVLLARRGDELFAVSATCTHYSGPLGEGLAVGETIRCPWHHACFSLRTGEALGAPAFDPIACWSVELRDAMVFVRGKRDGAEAKRARDPFPGQVPRRIVIIGGGGAGFAAAEMLRRRGFDGELTMLSEDNDPPYDRPNLSKHALTRFRDKTRPSPTMEGPAAGLTDDEITVLATYLAGSSLRACLRRDCEVTAIAG